MNRFIKIKCKECDRTIAFRIEDKITIRCDRCGEDNEVPKEMQFKDLTKHLAESP